ncbi:MAG TPA: hypothetical protein VFS93_05250 [Terrimesophilobacter sp.]|nr:hypothetical protein [Terrimesophilobacter sp.]
MREPDLVFTIGASMEEVIDGLYRSGMGSRTPGSTALGLAVYRERRGLLFDYGFTRVTFWAARLSFELVGVELLGRVRVDRPRSPFGRRTRSALIAGIRGLVLDIDEDARILTP